LRHRSKFHIQRTPTIRSPSSAPSRTRRDRYSPISSHDTNHRLRNDTPNTDTYTNFKNLPSSYKSRDPSPRLLRSNLQIPPSLRRRLAKPPRTTQHASLGNVLPPRPPRKRTRPLRQILDQNPRHLTSPVRKSLFLRLRPHDPVLPDACCFAARVAESADDPESWGAEFGGSRVRGVQYLFLEGCKWVDEYEWGVCGGTDQGVF